MNDYERRRGWEHVLVVLACADPKARLITFCYAADRAYGHLLTPGFDHAAENIMQEAHYAYRTRWRR